MVNTYGRNVNIEAAPTPEAPSRGTPVRPRSRPQKAAKAQTMTAPVATKMVERHEEEVDEAPSLHPVPNCLDETLHGIQKAMDTFVALMAMQTQQNLQMGIQTLD